jgi:transcriptional regulator NrdR family protein
MSARCPACAAPSSSVLNTRTRKDGTLTRQRRCAACGHRWHTIEVSAELDAEVRRLRRIVARVRAALEAKEEDADE